MSDWKTFAITVPGKSLLESARSGLQAILIFLEIVKAILETVKIFLIDFGNPVRVILQQLLKLIEQLFETLKQTGLYAYYDLPNPTKDPSFSKVSGGYQAFAARFKGSLFDSKDPNRPQPLPGATKSGFVLIVLDAQSVGSLVALVKTILRFFGKSFSAPQYKAPANAKVLPLGSKGDPILSVPKVFAQDLKGLSVEWSLPSTTNRADGSFSGLLSSGVSEFIPPKFLIEKTSIPNGEVVTFERETPFEDKKGNIVKRKEKARDEYGDVFRKFEKYIVVDPTTNTGTFLLGQLGQFRYIDNDVEKDKTYYYRVRAFSGSLDFEGLPGNLGKSKLDPATNTMVMAWPSKDPSNPPTMGRPTGMLTGRVPTLPANFDVIGNLERIFRAAYSLGFHLPPAEGDTFDSNTGLPLDDTTPVSEIGKGTLTEVSGPLGSTLFDPSPVPPEKANTPDPITGDFPLLPHFYRGVRFQSSRMAQTVASALLENSSALLGFRSLQQGTLPHAIAGKGYLSGVTTLEGLVNGYNQTIEGIDFLGYNFTTYDPRVYETYNFAFTDPNVRLNMVVIVNFIKSFTLGGREPDWIRVSFLRDIIPWSGQFIYELLDKIDALLAAFNSIIDEIIAFIDLIERKITILEQFIQYLISILDFIESLQFSASILSAPSIGGGTPEWISTIDSAGGAKPKSGPGSYTAGICLAYVAPDISAFSTAFNLIF